MRSVWRARTRHDELESQLDIADIVQTDGNESIATDNT